MMMSLSLMIPTLLLASSLIVHSTHAFSAASDGIKIVGLPGGQVQSLPGMYVENFRRWIVDDNEKNKVVDGDESMSSSSCASLKMEPIKGAGLFPENLPDEGWVNPTTTSELWWPRDLPTLQIRPMFNVLFRNGVLSYVSAGLDVRTVPQNDDDVDVSWRNYGMNSQPIARQWTTLDIAMEKLFHVEGFIVHDDSDDTNDNEQHEVLFPSLNVQEVMQKVATFISELDSLSPLAEGFHIASFPMMQHWTDLPPSAPKGSENTLGEKKGKVDTTDSNVIYKIVCLATSEPFANKLLDMDEDLLTMSSTSVLEVDVSRTARGGDSPYLTEPYIGLYLNK